MPLLSIMNGYFRGHAEGSQFHGSRGSDPAPSITQPSMFLPINTENPILSRQLPESSRTALLDRVHRRTFLTQKIQGLCVAVWVFQSS